MHFEGLDLNLLVALDALLSERNVTRAAERLHVSQPAMSAALQKLRVHLSDPLLGRVGRQLELTPRAQALAGPVKELLFQVRSVLRTEVNFDPSTADRRFTLVMSSYCAEIFGVPLVKYLARVAPNISCQLDDLSSDALSRVYDGQADICVTLPQGALFDPVYSSGEMCEQLLFRDHFVLVGAEANSALGQQLDYGNFCRLRYVETRFGGKIVSNVEQLLHRQAERPDIQGWTPSFLHAMAITSGTDMVTIVPSRLAERHAGSLGLRILPAPLPLIDLEEVAFWHPRTELDPGHQWLRSVMLHVAANLHSENEIEKDGSPTAISDAQSCAHEVIGSSRRQVGSIRNEKTLILEGICHVEP